MQTLILATKNAGKVREIKDITGDLCHVLTMTEAGIDIEIDETGTTFTENARIKARAVWEARRAAGFNDTVISDDSGIEIDFFDRQPGIYSSRWLGEDTPYTEKNQIILDYNLKMILWNQLFCKMLQYWELLLDYIEKYN